MRVLEDRPDVIEPVENTEDLFMFIKNMNEIFFLVDEHRIVVAASNMAMDLFGFSVGEDANVRIDEFLPRVYLDAIFRRTMEDDIKKMKLTFPVKNINGREVLLETRFNWYRTSGRSLLSLTCRDINEYMNTISDLSEREDRYRTIFHESPLGFIYINSDGIITDCNSAFLSIFGLDKSDVMNICLAEDNDLKIYNRFNKAAMDAVVGVNSRHEAQFQSADGKNNGWVRVSFSPVISDNNAFLGAVGIVEDITEAKQAVEKISFVSSHDALTGLYNRHLCEESLVNLDRKENLPLGIIYADLNCLKLANDAFGHHEGDVLLTSAANILRENAGKSDMIFRWGGDEFIMLLPNTDKESVEERVNGINRMCHSWKGTGLVRPSMALGCSVKNFADTPISEVISEAEDTMYSNKLRDGRPTRLRILGALEAQMHGMMNGAVSNRCRRMIMWGDWITENIKIDCDSYILRLLCRYHDVGLLACAEELEVIRGNPSNERIATPLQHMAVGYRIARCIAEIAPVADQILSHHEWWDGMGYPNQQRGNDIPIASRIVSIFDSIEGMLSLNSSSSRMPLDNVLDSIEACAGKRFDPFIVQQVVSKLRDEPPKFALSPED
ncbi:MAG: diguanylate cyclase [Synergistaceae bacterium]|jgi:diguanylate cyclase (GGDEF)-like protein/PAS domain S-box-containing protein|nr:diguanylate cyclase [Synergistaceae bacterium]